MFALSPARLGRVVLTGCVCALALSPAGCQKGKAHVTGTVKFSNGQPMTGGTVSFITSDNRVGTSLIDKQGNYDVPDAPVGEARIFITVPPMPMGPVGMPPPPPGMGPMKPPDGSSLGPKDSPTGGMPDPRELPKVPERYLKAETSGLTYKVTRGKQTHPIVLEW